MNRQQRLDEAHAAVRSLSRHPDPAALSDGLSPAMARACLQLACDSLGRQALDLATQVPGLPPNRAAVVAARGVFTAPLEWVALLAALGSEVLLKVPSQAPQFGGALATAFTERGLPVRTTTSHDLEKPDAIVAMGNDETMSALADRYARARLLLHGHRFSVAVVRGQSPALARQLSMDALLYDGRGCFTPVAVLHLGGPESAAALTGQLALQLPETARRYPPGQRDPLSGPQWRRRTGLARTRGSLSQDPPPATALLPLTFFDASALPGFLPVHPVADLEELQGTLGPWTPWLAACATDLEDPAPLLRAGFERICRPGTLQAPPIPRPHGGREMLRPLMRVPSLEIPHHAAERYD